MKPEQECQDILNHYLNQINPEQISSKSDVRVIVNKLRDLQMDLIRVSWKDESQILRKLRRRT